MTGVDSRFLASFAALAFALLATVGSAAAQSAAPPPPALEPLPEIPSAAGDPDLEPQVTIIRREEEVVEEVRIGGELRYVRVTPRHGRPYFLVPDASGQAFIRRDSLDSGLKVPLWVLFSW
jgi:hypothetical protein